MEISQLPYQADSASLFAHFAQQPYAVFIDSCGLGRFDIISANPSRVVRVTDLQQDPFLLAKQQLSATTPVNDWQIPPELPFTTGVISYFSYDSGYQLAQIAPTATADISIPKAVIGFYDWSVVVDHHRHTTYFISQASQNHPEITAIKNQLAQPAALPGGFALTSSFLPNMDKAQYAIAFNRIKQHIQAGDCYQINLAQRFTATYQGCPWVAYQRLRFQHPAPMASYMKLPEGAVLCLSPERFLQVNQRQVITQPIKGTRPRFADPAQDQVSAQALLNSEKDRAENIMIVDLLRNDLGKCCQPGSIQVPKLCALESFATVHHLISTVTGILEEGQHPLDVLRHCFPGGSITGAPKRRAMEIIDQLEPHQRALYCGSIAYCDIRDRMDSNIAIRTLLCNDQKIHCYGGGGIVHDSTMENEYQEIQAKISILLNGLDE